MTETDAVAAFKRINTQGLLDIHSLGSARLQVLWVLQAGKKHTTFDLLTPAQISDVLVDCYGVPVARQRVRAILVKEGETVSRRRIRGREYFKLMKAGEDLLQASTSAPILIDPARGLSGIREVEGILSGLKGHVRVCDPYVESKSLDLLAACACADTIKLLTVEVHKEERFKRDLRAFNLEHGSRLEVRRHAPGLLHDRYVLHEGGALLLGGSLNGLGMKQSFIWAAGPDLSRSAQVCFEKNWRNAHHYP